MEWNGKQYPVDKNDFSFSRNGEKVCFDFAYITIHGNPGENGMLQGYLDMMGIPYSTCSVLGEALTFDKYTCTNYLQGFGIETTHPVMLLRGKEYDREAILKAVGLPCFVKPNAEGLIRKATGNNLIRHGSIIFGFIIKKFLFRHNLSDREYHFFIPCFIQSTSKLRSVNKSLHQLFLLS